MRAIVLPGLDGTGLLLDAFVASLAPVFDAEAVAYPAHGAGDYDALTHHAIARLPRDAPYILIAESFSGPIGIRIAAQRPEGLAGLVLCATFARTPDHMLPRPLARMVSRLPLRWLPTAPLHAAMMGRWSTSEWRQRTEAALARIADATLRTRWNAVLQVDVTPLLAAIRVPVLYLQASRDRVVPRTSRQAIVEALPTSTMEIIEGPHFLLQVRAAGCAHAIAAWCDRRLRI